MSFTNRNLYYLRVAHNTILPLYVYLDEQHISWMSDFILQRVLLDLRPHVLCKLGLDTIKMDELRRRISVLLFFPEYRYNYNRKRRFYIAEAVSTDLSQSGKRKARSNDPTAPKKRKRRETQTTAVNQSVAEASQQEEGNNGAINSFSLTVTGDDTTPKNPSVLNEDDFMDIAEEKPKPRMQLKYEGFHINGQCLCVVVEPLSTESSPTTMLHDSHESNQEPLFLLEQETSLIDDLSLDTGRGMMTLSQRLHTISADYTTGLIDDGEDSEEEISLGDAEGY